MANDPTPEAEDPNAKKKYWLIFWAIIGSLTLIFTVVWFVWLRFIAYTDDAYVEGNQIYITPMQDGVVIRIHTDDTYLVKQGQVIAELDPTYEKIALNSAQDHLAKTVREVCQIFHRTFALQAEIETKLAELILAKQDWEHRIHVIDQGGVSLENLQHAEAELRAKFFNFKATERKYLESKAMIEETSIRSNPLVQEAEDRLRDCVVRLYRTKIYAPNTGLIAQRTIQVGMYAKAGEPMMSVIPLDQIWINANYKETQMKHMRIGQSAKVTADFYGREVVFDGVIVGMPGGAGNAFSLLPPQNLSGNWIKIVQRLPVRIGLKEEQLMRHPLRIGLTCHATTDMRYESGLRVPDNYSGPLYTTEILVEEEGGADELSDEIITKNIDPSLKMFEYETYNAGYSAISDEMDQLFSDSVEVDGEDY